MQFTYRPDGAEAKVWEFKPNKLMSPESEAIERLTGWTFPEWQEYLDRGSVRAFHALLYVFMKRDIPTLKYDEVQFSMSEVELDLDQGEKDEIVARLRERAAAGEMLTEGEAAVLSVLGGDTVIDVAPDAPATAGGEDAVDDDEGKGPGTD